MSQPSSSSMAQGISTTHRPTASNNHPHSLRSSAAGVSRGSPMRRPVFRSQIPIRARYGHPYPSTPQNAHLRSLAHHHHRPHDVRPGAPRALTSASEVHPAVAISLAENKNAAQSLERAFAVYAERLEADLRDFRGLCVGLVTHEQHEKDKWHSLCMKIMKERDLARQVVDELVQEREDIGIPTDVRMIERGATNRDGAVKRGREEDEAEGEAEGAGQESKSDAGSDKAQRPVRSLRGLSPTVSPPGSPSYPVYPAYLPPSPTSRSCSLPPKPHTSQAPAFPESSTKSAASAPASITTFSVDGNTLEPPHKRRKSYDGASSTTTAVEIENRPLRLQITNGGKPQQSRTPSPGAISGTVKLSSSSVIAPGEFCHVDLMYIPVNGALTCRACLLNSKTKPTSHDASRTTAPGSQEPKSFTVSASWDQLRDHCVKEHPDACADVARLHPAEIFELRRRLSLST